MHLQRMYDIPLVFLDHETELEGCTVARDLFLVQDISFAEGNVDIIEGLQEILDADGKVQNVVQQRCFVPS